MATASAVVAHPSSPAKRGREDKPETKRTTTKTATAAAVVVVVVIVVTPSPTIVTSSPEIFLWSW
jgi:hypothetical protein